MMRRQGEGIGPGKRVGGSDQICSNYSLDLIAERGQFCGHDICDFGYTGKYFAVLWWVCDVPHLLGICNKIRIFHAAFHISR